MGRVRTRREFLGALGAGVAGALIACSSDGDDLAPLVAAEAEAATPTPTPMPRPPEPTPTPTATPEPTPRPPGDEVRTLLPGTPWETSAFIRSTGLKGPALVVLGGVHGNEPGGWEAASLLPAWEPEVGVLAVVPRANELAIADFVRLVDGEGDLNRQFPGDPGADLPTARLAWEITELARELRAEVLLDLHESWMFYISREEHGFVSRSQSGTAFLGQTILSGTGPRSDLAEDLAASVNESITDERELLIPLGRGGWRGSGDNFMFGSGAPPPGAGRGGRSTLSLGNHVPGMTSLIIEMGQYNQPLERRVELHLAAVRATMDILEM